jgi:serine/threonine protein phosphatase PrpC
VACLLVFGEEFAAVWSGDSRVYQLRQGALSRLSIDHSRVQELVDARLLRPEEASRHPDSHIVIQAIGAGRLHFGTRVGMVRPGDRFLLCTDGLTNMVADDELAVELGTGTPQAGAERLLDLVLARGAVDNTTIVVVAAESS